MLKYLLAILFFMFGVNASAQENDSLFVVKKGAKWAIKYTVKPREYIRMLAKRFFISEGVLLYANDEEAIKKLAPGDIIYIPVTKENYLVSKPSLNVNNIHDVYYHVAPKDDIGILSTYAGITKTDMRTWNNLKGNTLSVDQVLFVGWVRMMDKDSTNPESLAAYPSPKKKVIAVTTDTVKVPVLGGLDTVYNRQTNNGLNVLTEKGTAVFFEKPGKNNLYYAFHNETPRGSIIKVFNPGSGKTIYVKVIGPVPDTKLYANCIIGICDAAKEALGITDSKAWCELSYAAN